MSQDVKDDLDWVLNWLEAHGDCSIPSLDSLNFDLAGSIFLAFTIMTSIGYGSYAPATKAGRIFAIVYAMVTLPIFAHALSLSQSYFGQALAPEGANRFKSLALTGVMTVAWLVVIGGMLTQQDSSVPEGFYFGYIRCVA